MSKEYEKLLWMLPILGLLAIVQKVVQMLAIVLRALPWILIICILFIAPNC